MTQDPDEDDLLLLLLPDPECGPDLSQMARPSPDVCGDWTSRLEIGLVARRLEGVPIPELEELKAHYIGHIRCTDCFPYPYYEAVAVTAALRRARG